MKSNRFIFLFLFWVAISGLTFTSCCLFNISSKICFVEIQEEEGSCEDGFEEDGDESLKNEKYFVPVLFQISETINYSENFSDKNHYNLLKGFYLRMIKPPLN